MKANGDTAVVPGSRHHVSDMTIIEQLASDDVLDSAYEWRYRQRRKYSANVGAWAFRREWAQQKEQIKAELFSANYRFSLLTRITLKDGEDTDPWSASDALVLKAMALVLGLYLPVSRRCTHIEATAVRNLPSERSATICRTIASCCGPR